MVSLLPKILAGLAFGFLALRSRSSGSENTVLASNLSRLRNSHADSVSTFAPGSSTQLIFGWRAGLGVPSALDWLYDDIAVRGRTVYYDITLASSDRFYLLSAPNGERPADARWAVLASPADVPAVQAYRAQPVPFEAGAPEGQHSAPASASAATNAAAAVTPPDSPAEQTGMPEVDALLRADDATPFQLRSIATELERAGNRAAADVVRRRADALYTSLRVAHTARGGTPWVIRANDNPDYLARHYGGTAQEILRLNSLNFPADWQIGKEWLLPLDWKVEGKSVPPLLKGASKKAAPKKPDSAKGTIPIYEASPPLKEGEVLTAQKAGDAVREAANIRVVQPARAGLADAVRRVAKGTT